MFDVVCVGGGVIGLMTAYELVNAGCRVAVLERGPIGREASWAGAGIVSPANRTTARTAYDRLCAVSFETFPILADALRAETGIDIEFHRTGGIELATDNARSATLAEDAAVWATMGLRFERLDRVALQRLEPELSAAVLDGYWLPDLCQVRNPRLLRALEAACRRRGVVVLPDHPVIRLDPTDSGVRITTTGTEHSEVTCRDVVVTAGPWSAGLLAACGWEVPVRPIRGQIVAYQTEANAVVRHIVVDEKRYLVPRQDGIVLVGSTEEDVGFDRSTTAEGIAGLQAFATRLYPRLGAAPVCATWAGLRPGSALGSPLLGRVPGSKHVWVATGHFREGVQLSPGTARLLSDWIVGRRSFAEPADFELSANRTQHRRPFHS